MTSLGTVFSARFETAAATTLLPVSRRRPLWLRAEVEVRDERVLSRWQLQAARQVLPAVRVELGGAWLEASGVNLLVTVSTSLPQARTVTQVMVPHGAPARFTQFAQGTAQWNDATGGVTLGPGPGLERGGLAGYVFFDANANGVRDLNEPGIGGVRLVVGARTVATDSVGRFAAWNLTPFEPLRVRVDSLSIPTPTWVPTHGDIEVHVPPSSYRRLDLAVTPAAEVSGRVVRAGPAGVDVPLGLIRLELTNRRTGARREVVTFSDGEFYVMGVAPGEYELLVAEDVARAFGLAPGEPLVLLVEPAPGGARVEGLVLRLVALP